MGAGSQLTSRTTTIQLLQGFEVCVGGQRVVLPRAVERVIAFLALHDARLHRVYVAGKLWTDSSQEAANACLRTTLWRLRRLPEPVVDVTPTHLSLARDVAVDLHTAAAVVHRLSTTCTECDDFEFQVLVQAHELLPDWYDDWVVIERERFRQAQLHALEALCEAQMRIGSYAKAVAAGLAAVAREPLRESAHRAVMRVHLAEGNPSEGLRQYELCRSTLSCWGLELSDEIERLRLCCCREASGVR